jgi:hypothetical protein
VKGEVGRREKGDKKRGMQRLEGKEKEEGWKGDKEDIQYITTPKKLNAKLTLWAPECLLYFS